MAVNCGYEYMNAESINGCLKCTVCSQPFIDPVSTKCKGKKHRFCRYCIEQHVKFNPSCPICRQNLNEEDLLTITDSFLIDMLDEILVKCVYCNQTDLERGNFAAHKNEMCPKTFIQCTASDIMCLWTGMRDELEKHLNSCIFNSLKPLITQLQNSNQPLNDQVKQQKTQIRELIRVNKQFNSKVKQQKTQIEELIRENTDLNEKIDVQQLAIEGFIEDNKQLHGKVDTQEFQELINKVNQQQTDIQGVQNENQRLKDQIQQLQNQMNRLENQPNNRYNAGTGSNRDVSYPGDPSGYLTSRNPPSLPGFLNRPAVGPYPPRLDFSDDSIVETVNPPVQIVNPPVQTVIPSAQTVIPSAQTVIPAVIIPIPIFIPVNWNINVPANEPSVLDADRIPAVEAARHRDYIGRINDTDVNVPGDENDADDLSMNVRNGDDDNNTNSSVRSADSNLSDATPIDRLIRRTHDYDDDDLYS